MPVPDWVRVLLAALAVYRLAQFVAIDHGPFGVFQWLRDAGGAYDRGPDGMPVGELGRLLACPYCSGVYFALAAAVLVLVPTLVGDIVLLWLGLAGAQAYLQGPRKPR